MAKRIPRSSASGLFITIFELPDGNFIAGGQQWDTDGATYGRHDGLIIKIKPNGDTLWHKTYRIPYMNANSTSFEIKDIRPTTDGGFICGGVVYTAAPDTGTQDMWVFKIDSNGCVDTSNCWVNPVGITEVIHPTKQLLLYPNPATATFTIELPNSTNTTGTFWLADVTGKQVFSKKINTAVTSLNISHLTKGIYFYRYLSNKQNTTYSGKLVLQ